MSFNFQELIGIASFFNLSLSNLWNILIFIDWNTFIYVVKIYEYILIKIKNLLFWNINLRL